MRRRTAEPSEARAAQAERAPTSHLSSTETILLLQRTAGNRAVTEALRDGATAPGRLDRPRALARQSPPAAPPSASAPPSQSPAVTPLTQAFYNSAVALVQARNPDVAAILTQGRVGQTVRVRTLQLPIQPGGPTSPTRIEFRFDLTINEGPTRNNARAQFDRRGETIDMTAPLATATLPLPITIRPLAAGVTPTDLAEGLVHEGIHALVHMDRMMQRIAPGGPGTQTGMLGNLRTYVTRARAHRDYSLLETTLEAFIGLTLPAARSRAAAEEVIERVIEERFALDQRLTPSPGPPPNNAIAREYVVNELVNVGVVARATDPTVAQAITLMTNVLGSIQPPGAPAASPAPGGSSSAPRTGSPPDAGAP